jgi:undecaprenyl-diphosphatase
MDITAAIINFDNAAILWMYQWGGNPPLDAAALLFSWIGTLRLVALTFGVYFWFKKETRPMTYILFSAVIICTLLVYCLKIAILRPRPFVMFGLAEADLLVKENPDTSFPSGHTAAAFATATILSYYFKKWLIPAFAAAVCAGLARIYLLVHYPSDVIAGAVIGILISLSVIYISQQVMKKRKGIDQTGN